MSREYANSIDSDVQDNLMLLVEGSTSPQDYQEAFVSLGHRLAERFCSEHPAVLANDITVAVTAEDADFLAKGFVEEFEKVSGKRAYLACFWNDHTKEVVTGRSIAPSIHEYLQPGYENNSQLVVIKSIISGSCVVRSNILALYGRMQNMEQVHIAAPVMYEGAEDNLKHEFPEEFAKKFDFTWFAKDNQRKADGEVVPGIGGQIYERLGLLGKPHEQNYMPNIVMERAIFS